MERVTLKNGIDRQPSRWKPAYLWYTCHSTLFSTCQNCGSRIRYLVSSDTTNYFFHIPAHSLFPNLKKLSVTEAIWTCCFIRPFLMSAEIMLTQQSQHSAWYFFKSEDKNHHKATQYLFYKLIRRPFFQVFIAIGILLCYVMGRSLEWNWLALASCVFLVPFTFGLYFIPEVRMISLLNSTIIQQWLHMIMPRSS